MGRLFVIEFDDVDNAIFEEIMQILHRSSDFTRLSLENKHILSVPGLEINIQQRKVYCDNQEVRLTIKEFDILCLLVTNKGNVVTYNQIYQRVWGECPYGKVSITISYHILNLRKKLTKKPQTKSFEISCSREVGYCFEVLKEENG